MRYKLQNKGHSEDFGFLFKGSLKFTGFAPIEPGHWRSTLPSICCLEYNPVFLIFHLSFGLNLSDCNNNPIFPEAVVLLSNSQIERSIIEKRSSLKPKC
jgi:hypothetical protein